jgi:hypothetical protein
MGAIIDIVIVEPRTRKIATVTVRGISHSDAIIVASREKSLDINSPWQLGINGRVRLWVVQMAKLAASIIVDSSNCPMYIPLVAVCQMLVCVIVHIN